MGTGIKKIIKDSRIKICVIVGILAALILFIAMNALPILRQSIVQDLKQGTSGHTEYAITSKHGKTFKVPEKSDDYEVSGVLALMGSIEGSEKLRRVQFTGFEYEDFRKLFGDTFNERGEVEYPKELKKDEVLISPELAEFINVKNEEKVKVKIGDKTKSFTVRLAPKDNYYVISNANQVIVNREDLRKSFDLKEDEITLAYLYNVSNKGTIKDNFSEKSYVIKQTLSEDYVENTMNTYYGVLIFIFFMLIFIVYDILSSSILIYITEKSREIGTLRSVGGSKSFIRKNYRHQALLLGVFSSVIGIILAMILLEVFSQNSLMMSYIKQIGEFSYMALTGAVVIVLLSSMLVFAFHGPVHDLLKQSDKDLLLGTSSIDKKGKEVKKYDIFAIPLVIFLILVQNFMDFPSSMAIVIINILLFFAVVRSLNFIREKIVNFISTKHKAGTSLIAAKNVGHNFYLHRTFKITATMAIFIILVGSLIFSVAKAMTDFYKEYRADGFVRLVEDEEFTTADLKKLEDLDYIHEILAYSNQQVKIVESDGDRNVTAIGTDDINRYDRDMITLDIHWKDGFTAEKFQKGDVVVISEILMNKYNLSLGDSIRISDGKTKKNFEVVGYTELLQDLGDMIYMNFDQGDFAEGFPTNGVYVKGSLPDDFEEVLLEMYPDALFTYRNVQEMKDSNIANTMQVAIFFVAFSLLVGLTSFTGIYNNYKLSHMTRKKEFAIMSSNGFSPKKLKQILSIEILLISLLSIIISSLIFILFKTPIENLVKLVDFPIELNLSMEVFLSMIFIILLMTIMNLLLINKTVKTAVNNIVINLKQE